MSYVINFDQSYSLRVSIMNKTTNRPMLDMRRLQDLMVLLYSLRHLAPLAELFRNVSQILATMFAVTTYPYDNDYQKAVFTPPSPQQTMLAVTDGNTEVSKYSPEPRVIKGIVAYIGGKHCANVMKLLGVHYDEVKGKREPDLSHLKLDFISPEEKHSFYLGDLATEIPNLRGLNGSKPLIIFLHGYTDDPTTINFKLINEAFQSIEHYNILALDSSSLISWLYIRASIYVRFIGEKLGETLVAMTRLGLNRKRVHLIGHSLGAHISGFAGRRFKELTGKRVGRVTGLDPAGPCFANVDKDLRLNHKNADFVDVIHTNAGFYGIASDHLVGHVDFYPNGGVRQPYCIRATCSHARVVQYYAESIINQNAFYGVKCSDRTKWMKQQCSELFSVMGHSTSKATRGKFYLRTNKDEPFGMGMEGALYHRGFLFGLFDGNNGDGRKMD